MRVCAAGHFIKDPKAKKCALCGEPSTPGHKLSLFLPHDLFTRISKAAEDVGESKSIQIVRMIRSVLAEQATAKRQ